MAKREKTFNDKVNKYKATKDQTMAEAKDFEAKRDAARAAATESSTRGSAMGLATARRANGDLVRDTGFIAADATFRSVR